MARKKKPLPQDPDQLLTPDELARRWSGRISVSTLRNWRSIGKGPPYTTVRERGRGLVRVRYRLGDVEAFEAAHKFRASPGSSPQPA